MKTLSGRYQRPHWMRLIAGMIATVLVSLSIHVVMLQVLGIPFPEFAAVSRWAVFCNLTLSVLAMVVFYSLAKPLRYLSIWYQWLLMFALYAMLKESLRGIVMAGVVTTGWVYDFAQAIPVLLFAFVTAGMVVYATPKLEQVWAKALGAGMIACISTFAIKPLLKIVTTLPLAWAAQFDHAEIHAIPYGWQVLIPAYITYLEPVLACMVIAWMVYPSLSGHSWKAGLQFSALILFMKGIVLPTFVYSFYSKSHLMPAMLSQSQFLLEAVALAILTAYTFSMSFPAIAAQVKRSATNDPPIKLIPISSERESRYRV